MNIPIDTRRMGEFEKPKQRQAKNYVNGTVGTWNFNTKFIEPIIYDGKSDYELKHKMTKENFNEAYRGWTIFAVATEDIAGFTSVYLYKE